MKLYDYYRSTACYRVRIALELKQLPYETVPIHLVNHGGEQHKPSYLALNPQGLVPTLAVDDHLFSQSLAIIDYLEEAYPSPSLLPQDFYARAQVKNIALAIACDIHPLNNLRVLQQLKQQFHANEEQTQAWYHHWLKIGFNSLEKKLTQLPRSMNVCYGNKVSLADICLIPQVYNAHRYEFPMDEYPLICAINQYCLSLEAFKKAAPKK